jgi:hypothetical protein
VSLSLVTTFDFFLCFLPPFLLLRLGLLLRGLATLSSLFMSLSEPESELESSLELSSLLETCFFFLFLFLFFFLFFFFSFFGFALDFSFFSEN